MVSVNDFKGITDSDIIESAINNRGADGIVLIPPRVSSLEHERTYWLIDRAILLPENTTVIMQNCTIKLSDLCRDNFFRSANCGIGIEDTPKIRNIHIKGEGECVLQGADHPRSTGDSSKKLRVPCPYKFDDLIKYADWIPEERKLSGKLGFWDTHIHTYGTDINRENESHGGDWRNIGILFANADVFSIENIKIKESHAWGISLEACSSGRIEKIDFDSCMSKEIDGMVHNIENQDGIDIRNGCHDIIISDITGQTGDDVIALTAIALDKENYIKGGSLNSTHVMHGDWSRRDRNIHDIIIRNVIAHSNLCYVVRVLPGYTKIWNIVIDGIIDTKPDGFESGTTITLGSDNPEYGNSGSGDMFNITVSNIVCRSKNAIAVNAHLQDSVICNVINQNPDCEAITLNNSSKLNNVAVSNVITAGKAN